ncbi:MAG: GNVR domain-containing protein [Ginsengibacter sp.]
MNIAQQKSENSNTTLFEDLKNKYLPYWPLFILLLVLFLIGSWIYLNFATPVYEITASMLITDERKGADENSMVESLNLLSSKKIVENELDVLHSRDLMDEVVNSLLLYAPIHEANDESAYNYSPVSVVVKDPSELVPVDRVNFRYDTATNHVIMDQVAYQLDSFINTPYGDLKFTANSKLITPSRDSFYFSLIDPKVVTNVFLSRLDVTTSSKLSSVVDLTLSDELPKRGEDILNTLLQKYSDESIEYKNKLAKNTIAFVNERLRVVSDELNSVEKKIQNYKSNEGIVDLTEQGKMYLQNVGDNSQKIADATMQLSILDQVERYINSKDNSAGIVPSTLGVTDPLLSKLLDRLYQAETDYQRLRKTTAENNPIIQSYTNEIQSIRPSILENIKSQKTNLRTTIANLQNDLKTFNSNLQSIPQKQRQLVEVSRDQIIKNNVYSFLLQKREETALSYASNVTDSKIIERAQASFFPVSPREKIVYFAAMVLAFGFTIAFVTLKELLTNKIISSSEVKNYTNVPVIGELPHFKEKDISPKSMDNEFIGAQFRQLKVALGLFNKSITNKKLLVTSSVAGEGKTFISNTLANSIAASGRQVVLIDSDFKNPQISIDYNLIGASGLSDFLENKFLPNQILKKTSTHNLFVIPAGKSKMNSTELFLNGKLEDLILFLEENFDHVVFDSPEVSIATDAYLLSEVCDTTIYAVRHQYTPKLFIKKLDDSIRIKSLGKIVLIYNALKPRGIFNNKTMSAHWADLKSKALKKNRKLIQKRAIM